MPNDALGSAYDAQYVPAMERAGVDLDAACAAGDLAPVRAWLRENIWQWARAEHGGLRLTQRLALDAAVCIGHSGLRREKRFA